MNEQSEPTEVTMIDVDNYITAAVKYDGDEQAQERQFFMSAGLIRRLAGLVGNQDDMSRMYVDPVLQEVLLVEAIRPRTERGKEIDPATYTLEDYEMDQETADRVLEWIEGHIFNFFIKSALKVSKAASDKNSPLQKLTQSVTGLQALLPEKQSAGGSAAN